MNDAVLEHLLFIVIDLNTLHTKIKLDLSIIMYPPFGVWLLFRVFFFVLCKEDDSLIERLGTGHDLRSPIHFLCRSLQTT